MRFQSRRDNYRYVYVAVVEGNAKIGATADPKTRYRGKQIVRVWEHESPAAIETICCDAWSHRRARCREFFDATADEAIAHVESVIAMYAAGERPISNALRARLKKGQRMRALLNGGMSFLDAAKLLRPDL